VASAAQEKRKGLYKKERKEKKENRELIIEYKPINLQEIFIYCGIVNDGV